jgi:hypothetical protein
MTEQQHTELVREFTAKSPKHPYPALDVDAMFAEIVRLQARVRELESTVLNEHSRLAQEEAKPAAVGVVGGRMTRYEYHCDAGSYSADSLLGLLREIVTHRFWHWRRGDGWVD